MLRPGERRKSAGAGTAVPDRRLERRATNPQYTGLKGDTGRLVSVNALEGNQIPARMTIRQALMPFRDTLRQASRPSLQRLDSGRSAPRRRLRLAAYAPWAGLFLGLCLVGCDKPTPPPNTRSGVDSVLHRYATASSRGDASALADLYQQAALLLPPDAGIIAGRDSIRAFWEDGLDDEVKFSAERVVIGENLAFAAGRYLVVGEESAPIDSGKFVLTLEREKNGTWAIAADIWNTTPSPDDTLERGERDPRARLAAVWSFGRDGKGGRRR